jgi:hypothetical protein
MKTTILVGLSFALCSIPSAYGQINEWTRQFGTSEYDTSNGISADGLGNVYVSGHTLGSLEGINAGKSDAFISKYDSSGTIQWTQQFGNSENDSASAVSADGLGNVYTSSSSRFELEPGITTEEYFINKYDSSGTLQWTQQLSTSVSQQPRAVSADGLGNVYISGLIYIPNSFGSNALIAKYNANGTIQWTRQLGSSEDDWSSGVSADGMGNVYISGTTVGDLAGTDAGSGDAFLTKYDASGTLQWTQQFGTSENDFSTSVSADGLGNVFIAGRTTGSLEGTNAGDNDAYVANYDSSGTLQWIQQFGTSERDGGTGVSADGLGNVYFSGYSEGSLASPSAGDRDVLVAKFNSLPLPPDPTADFNSDDKVDGDDLSIWDTYFGIVDPFGRPAHEFGDADEDGDIDGNDFLIWQTENGLGVAASASSASVPEPSTLLLASLAGLLFCSRRR